MGLDHYVRLRLTLLEATDQTTVREDITQQGHKNTRRTHKVDIIHGHGMRNTTVFLLFVAPLESLQRHALLQNRISSVEFRGMLPWQFRFPCDNSSAPAYMCQSHGIACNASGARSAQNLVSVRTIEPHPSLQRVPFDAVLFCLQKSTPHRCLHQISPLLL